MIIFGVRYVLHIFFPDNHLLASLREGFLKAIQLCLRLVPGGLATAGPPCGSFVFINRWTSGRSRTRPLGNKRGYVQAANQLLVP